MPPLEPGDPDDAGRDEPGPADGRGGGADDDGVDDAGFRPPLPPEDRLWRHPSEVAGGLRVPVAAPVPAPAPAAPARARTAGLVLLSAGVGAVLAVAAVSLLGGFDERVIERQVALQPTTLLDEGAGGVAQLAASAAPSVAALVVERDGRELAGSAVVLRADGYLVTDAEVVRGADHLDVVLHGGDVVAGRVVGVDDVTGVAVVRVDAEGLRAATIGRATGLAAGARTVLVAASADGGWHTSVSTGVVSTMAPRVEGSDGTARYGMIVVDKPFGPGAPGGALVDAAGAVVGIAIGARLGDDGAAHGLATPIELAQHVADQLIDHGRVQHVWLGLHGRDLDVADASALGHHGGAVVGDVAPGSPAARAGVQPGDVVVSVDGDATPSMAALISVLRLRLPGDVVVLGVLRDGTAWELRVDLEAKDA